TMPAAPTAMTAWTSGRCARRWSMVAEVEVTISSAVTGTPISTRRGPYIARVAIELLVANRTRRPRSRSAATSWAAPGTGWGARDITAAEAEITKRNRGTA